VPDSSHINCGLNLGIPLPLGVYQVIVTNPDAQEGVLDGFLVMEPLTVTDIDPNTGRNDDGALYATLTGTGLDALVTSVRLVLGAEIIEATDLDPTGHQLNCIFNLIGATTGVYDVVVSAEDGAEATLPNAFTVTEEFTLTGIDPTSGSDIEIVSVTITGGGFINDPAFSIALVREGYLAIVGVNINILDHGNLTCDFDLRGAEPGLWSLYANNGLGEEATLPDCFTITSSGSLTVTGINPTSAYTNETVPCTVYGGGFELAPISAVELHLGATSIPATEITVLNDTTLICTFYLAGMAFPGVWSLFVYNDTPEEAHLDDCFTIYDPPPEIGWIVPDNGSNDSPVTIDIYGGYFVDGITAVLFLGETSLVGDPVVFNTDGWITATFDTLDATPGIWSLRVTNPDMQDAILPDCFTLTASGSVTVTSIDPNHGPSGTTVVITDLHGTGFQDGATVRFNKTGREIYATNVVVLSENQITCEFPIPPGANGIWNITVTNPDFSWGQMLEGFTSGF
jgi:hypothetical protein